MHTKAVVAALLAGSMALCTSIASAKTIRGHHVGGGHSQRHHGHHGGGLHFSYYHHYPYYAYSYYNYPWYPFYVGYGPRYVVEVAYIDTDVSPEKAEVYLDGEYVGIADNFDGFPRHLRIEPGRHTVTFKAEGYRTTTRHIKAPRGAVVNLTFRMVEGEAEEPVEYLREGLEIESAPDLEDENAGSDWDDATGPGFIRLRISPSDATVYLDGEFYAPASILAGLHGKLRLESGIHLIEVVKPGYRPAARQVEITPGDRVTVTIDLEKGTAR